MFLIDKNKTKEQKLNDAKIMVAGIISLALANNPQYKAPIAAFCAATTGNLADSLADAVAKKLNAADDPADMALIKLALNQGGFYGFPEIDQLEIIREICGLVN
jgi:hypothetical protein